METNEPACPQCGGTLFVRGLFYVDSIPLAKDESQHLITPTDGNIQDADENLEVYCVSCDYVMGMDEYVREEKEK